MRIKIFGAGSIGNHMAHAFRTLDFEVSIFDNDIDALERMQNEIYPERYGGWDERINLYSSIDSFKGYYDIVVIGTPPSSHLEIALQVINQKPKALLIEKPLTYPFDKNLKKFYKIARDSETRVFVGYNHIVSKSMQKVNEILNNNLLGKLFSIDVSFRENWDGIFKAHPWLDGPKESYLGYYKKGGGATSEHSHAINMWQHLSRQANRGRIKELSSFIEFKTDNVINYDSISFLNVLSDDNLFGRIVQDVVTKPHQKVAEVIGENGSMKWFCNFSQFSDRVVLEKNNCEKETYEFKKTRKDDFLDEIKFILENINQNIIKSDIDLVHGIETMKVIEAAFISNKKQKNIIIEY